MTACRGFIKIHSVMFVKMTGWVVSGHWVPSPSSSFFPSSLSSGTTQLPMIYGLSLAPSDATPVCLESPEATLLDSLAGGADISSAHSPHWGSGVGSGLALSENISLPPPEAFLPEPA